MNLRSVFFLGLKDIMREEMQTSNKVAIIIISKSKDSLHQIFSSASGWHFVHESIVLTPPDLEKREQMMNALIQTAGCCLANFDCAR